MKPEHLETLLLDRALNQLAPEVADLLDAHLARDDAAARRAAALTATVALARESAEAPRELAVPREADAWQRIQRAWRWRMAGWETLKLAAGVAVGLGLAFAWPARGPSPTSVVAAGVPPVVPHPAPAFWSTARFVAEAQRDVRRSTEDLNRYQPRWLSPAKRLPGEGQK